MTVVAGEIDLNYNSPSRQSSFIRYAGREGGCKGGRGRTVWNIILISRQEAGRVREDNQLTNKLITHRDYR